MNSRLLSVSLGLCSIGLWFVLLQVSPAWSTGFNQPPASGGTLYWAVEARASSQFGASGWSARQATGQPNSNRCGDIRTAWAPKKKDHGFEWIELGFGQTVRARGVRIVETYNPGAVVKIEIQDQMHIWKQVWSGVDQHACPGVLEVLFPQEMNTSRVRITLDTRKRTGWNEIDAVALIGALGLPTKAIQNKPVTLHWARNARASSQYGQSKWSAHQATGAPNSHKCADLPTAWAAKKSNGGNEWLELEFASLVWASGLRVVENFHPGAVVEVQVPAPGGAWSSVWKGQDTTSSCPGQLDITFPRQVRTQQVRIVLNTSKVSGWNEIDAVALVQAQDNTTVGAGSKNQTSGQQNQTAPSKQDLDISRPIVAVFNIEVKNMKLRHSFVDGLTDYLSIRLTETNRFQVLPRDALRQRLNLSKKDSHKDCYDQNCQIEMGRELAAEKILTTKILKLGSRCTVNLALFDLKKAAAEDAATSSGKCNEDGLMDLLNEAVRKIAQ